MAIHADGHEPASHQMKQRSKRLPVLQGAESCERCEGRASFALRLRLAGCLLACRPHSCHGVGRCRSGDRQHAQWSEGRSRFAASRILATVHAAAHLLSLRVENERFANECRDAGRAARVGAGCVGFT